MRRPAGENGIAVGTNAHELQPLGKDGAIAGFDFVGQEKEKRRLQAFIRRINQHGSLPQQVGVLLKDHVGDGQHQRMAGVHEHRAGSAWLVERLNGLALETDALVAPQHRLLLTTVSASEPAIALTDCGGNVGDFKAFWLTRMRAVPPSASKAFRKNARTK